MGLTQNILRAEMLSIGYRGTAGDRRCIHPPFSLAAKTGELVALVGRNGVGKSTLLRTLAGLQKPLDGSVNLLDRTLPNYSRKELAELVSFVAAEPVRVANLKVFDLVALGRFPYTGWFGGLSNDDKKRVFEALDLVGLSGFAWRNIDHLSDGERQRAMIARSLAQDTRVIIFDEPTAFIDLPNKYEIVMLLRRLAHQSEKTIIFSTHDLSIALRMSDKLWLMSPDKFYSGAPEDLALQRVYDELFEHTSLMFDSRSGNVCMDVLPTRELAIVGDCDLFWPRKTFERLGFRLYAEESNNRPTLHVSQNEDGKLSLEWQNGEASQCFNSLYELSLYVRTILPV